MKISRILLLISLLPLSSCAVRENGQCESKLDYVTNSYTAGEKAIRHASEYKTNFLMGSDDFTVSAKVDMASSDLVVSGKSFAYGDDTAIRKNSSSSINAKDNIDIACLEDFSLQFSLAKNSSASPNVLGLAYDEDSAVLDQLVEKAGFKDVFSLALCAGQGDSRLVLGGIDEYMTPLIGNFIPIIEKSAYVVPALNLKQADTKKLIGDFPRYDPGQKTGTRTIIDSGSAFLLLPTDMATELSDQIQEKAKFLGVLDQFPAGFFRTERSNSIKIVRFANKAQIRQFPSFEINFQGYDGDVVALEISPLHYFKQMDPKNPLERTFAIRETHRDVVLGQPFLENHYSYFDRKNGRIGFADSDIGCAK